MDATPNLSRGPTYSPLLDQGEYLGSTDAKALVEGTGQKRGKDPLQLKRELEDLTDRLTELQSSLYEIEEARHSAGPVQDNEQARTAAGASPTQAQFQNDYQPPTLLPPASQKSTPRTRSQLQTTKIDLLLQALTTHLEDFSLKISAASVEVAEGLSGVEAGDEGAQSGQVGSRDQTTPAQEVPTRSTQAHTPSRRRPPRPSTTLNPNPKTTHLQIHRLLTDLQKSWASLVDREETLREELMEDRLVGVFREGARGAEEAMGSLERARVGLMTAHQLVMSTEPGSDVMEVIETALSAMGSWEQKKKFWIAGLTKCFAILDKNLRSRTTVNGEVLRRHSELSARWKALRIPIAEADALIPRMKRQIGLLDPRNGGGGTSAEGDLVEGDESAELLTEVEDEGEPGELRGHDALGLGSPDGLTPRRLGSGIPRASTAGGVSTRARTSTQGSDGLGRPSFDTDSSTTSSPARQRTVSGPELRKQGGSGGTANGLMSALRKMSLGGSKAPKVVSQPTSSATPSLDGTGFSPISTPWSPQAGSDAGSSYFGLPKKEPKFSTSKPRWNGAQRVEGPAEYDPSFCVDPVMASPSAGKAARLVSRRKSGLVQEVPDRRCDRSPKRSERSVPPSPDKTRSNGASTSTPIINRRRSFLPLPTHASPHRPTSPAFSVTSTTPSLAARTASHNSGRPPAPSPSPGRGRSTSTSDVFSTPPPPVPSMPNREQLQQKEARAAALRSIMQTPEPTLRSNAAKMPFYAGRQPSAGYMASPSRVSSGGGGSGLGPMTPGMERRLMTPSRTPSRQSMAGPPSAFRGVSDRPRSPASNAGTRAGASTPLPGIRGGLAFVPNKIDDLDVALASLLDEIPNDLLVERVDPPLRRGHLHEGEWRARYAITTGRNGRREYELRLLILNKPGTGPGGKTRKIMIKDGMVSKDLRLFVLEMA